MTLMPIQVVPEGVLIPLEYLQNAHEFEFEVVDGHVLIRPKPNGQPAQKNWLSDLIGMAEKAPTSAEADATARYPWIGITRAGNPNASVEVEDILAAEIDIRSGWTLKR